MSQARQPGYQTSLSQAATIAETEPDEPEGPDCHHDPVWIESGTCMACEPAWSTGDDAESYREQNPDIYGRNPL